MQFSMVTCLMRLQCLHEIEHPIDWDSARVKGGILLLGKSRILFTLNVLLILIQDTIGMLCCLPW